MSRRLRPGTLFPFLLALATTAGATTFVNMSDRLLARAADAVVVGTVDRIEGVAGTDGAISTLVTVRVERRLKGRTARRIVLRQPGGRVGDRMMWIAGSPEFRVGQRDLLFLSAHRDGTARTTAFGMGQYHLVSGANGRAMAERTMHERVVNGAPHRRVSLARLLREIRRTVAAHRDEASAPLVTEPVELTQPGLGRMTVEAFTLMDAPHGRWHEPDLGQPVVYGVDPAGDQTLGVGPSTGAIDAALAAWTNVTGATIHMVRGQPIEPAPLFCDGISQIVFNDPFDEMPSPVQCSGVLALGGYCTSTNPNDTDVVDGTTFVRISEGNITFNRGFGNCSFWNATNLAEVATHEIGHTIGLGHSSENDDEPNPVLKEATMYYRAHFDGRGASLKTDDVAGVRAIYPGQDEGTADDQDADGVKDAEDNCPGNDPKLGVYNPAQTDTDGDGVGDVCDPCPLSPGGADDTSCTTIDGNRLRLTAKGALRWTAFIGATGSGTTDARALLVNGDGVLVDTQAPAALRRGASRTFRGDRVVIRLKPAAVGGYRILVRGSGIAMPTNGSLLSASLSVGDQHFATALACRRAGNRLVCS